MKKYFALTFHADAEQMAAMILDHAAQLDHIEPLDQSPSKKQSNTKRQVIRGTGRGRDSMELVRGPTKQLRDTYSGQTYQLGMQVFEKLLAGRKSVNRGILKADLKKIFVKAGFSPSSASPTISDLIYKEKLIAILPD